MGQKASKFVTQRSRTLGLIVPAYFGPQWQPEEWKRLGAAASVLRSRLIVIVNPANGPVDENYEWYADYVASIGFVQREGAKVLGYVSTRYGGRPAKEVEADMALWHKGFDIDGFFLDETPVATPGDESYYQRLYAFAARLDATALVLNNGGAVTGNSDGYLVAPEGKRVSDMLGVFENNKRAIEFSAPDWMRRADRDHFFFLAWQVRESEWRNVLDRARRNNVGFVYATDDGFEEPTPNPWDALPSYFEDMVRYAASIKFRSVSPTAAQRAAPAASATSPASRATVSAR